MGRWRDNDYYFPPSTPRSVKGGIKAQSKQGAFGKSWWAKRWIQVLEGFNIGARLGRGRSYARQGQVTAITIDQGRITAAVQGSRPKPYDVTITVKGIATSGRQLGQPTLARPDDLLGNFLLALDHFDRWWNPAVENQATDRAFRIGQTKNVQVHKYLCAGTLEEKIDDMIERKKDVAEQVVGTGEGWLTELSNEHLKELFTLRAEAVGA